MDMWKGFVNTTLEAISAADKKIAFDSGCPLFDSCCLERRWRKRCSTNSLTVEWIQNTTLTPVTEHLFGPLRSRD